MKVSKSTIVKICIIAGFISSVQILFATDIVVRKDNPVPPPDPMPARVTIDDVDYPVSASIDNDLLTVSFDEYVGDATISVYDENNQLVYQEVLDTDVNLTTCFSAYGWDYGDYVLKINYGTTYLIGDFTIY